jgi:hypothetical protein
MLDLDLVAAFAQLTAEKFSKSTSTVLPAGAPDGNGLRSSG